MHEYMTLMGAEQVAAAGYSMRDTAQEMHRAVSSLDKVLQ